MKLCAKFAIGIIAWYLIVIWQFGILTEAQTYSLSVYLSQNPILSIKMMDYQRGLFSSHSIWSIETFQKQRHSPLVVQELTNLLQQNTIEINLKNGPILYDVQKKSFVFAFMQGQWNFNNNNRSYSFSNFLQSDYNGNYRFIFSGKANQFHLPSFDCMSELSAQNYFMMKCKIQGMRYSNDYGFLNIAPLEFVFSHTNPSFQFWPAEYQMSTPFLQAQYAKQNMALSQIILSIKGGVNTDKINLSIHNTFDTLRVNEMLVSKGDISFDINNVSILSLDNVLAYIDDDAEVGAVSNEVDPFFILLSNFASQSPEIIASIHHLDTQNGTLKFHFQWNLFPSMIKNQTAFNDWISASKFVLNTSISLKTIEDVLMYYFSQELDANYMNYNLSQQTLESIARHTTQLFLIKWILAGGIILKGDILETAVRYENHKVYINGILFRP